MDSQSLDFGSESVEPSDVATDAQAESTGIVYFVDGIGGTKRAYKAVKRKNSNVKKLKRVATVESRTCHRSILSSIYDGNSGSVRKCCKQMCIVKHIGFDNDATVLSYHQCGQKENFIRQVCSTRKSIYDVATNKDEERDQILNLLKLGWTIGEDGKGA